MQVRGHNIGAGVVIEGREICLATGNVLLKYSSNQSRITDTIAIRPNDIQLVRIVLENIIIGNVPGDCIGWQ